MNRVALAAAAADGGTLKSCFVRPAAAAAAARRRCRVVADGTDTGRGRHDSTVVVVLGRYGRHIVQEEKESRLYQP